MVLRTLASKRSLRRAAERGDLDAMADLGGELVLAGERDEAERWFRQAAEAGSTRGMVRLGSLLAATHREAEGEVWLRRAAATGDAEAMYGLGECLRVLGRTNEAVIWLRRAAESGDHALARGTLGGLLLAAGDGREAEHWLRLAAGDPAEVGTLALRLREQGQMAAAERRFQRAAEDGDAEAMAILGGLLAHWGRSREAESWLSLASEAALQP